KMGNSRCRRKHGADAANGALCRTCVGNRGLVLAPQVGFEPTTLRLTARQVHQNTGTYILTNGFFPFPYLTNPRHFSRPRRMPLRGAAAISVVLRCAIYWQHI